MVYSTVASVTYLDKASLYEREKPFICTISPWNVPDARQNNLQLSPHDVTIKDMRDKLESFSTDTHGFSVLKIPTKLSESEFGNDDFVRDSYYAECTEILKQQFGATKVHIFDHTFRDAKFRVESQDPRKQLVNEEILNPGHNAHVDQTPASVKRRVRAIYGEEAEELLQKRIRLLNLWRPLISPCQDQPLAVCDYRSTVESDYVATDVPSPIWLGEVALLNHNPNHQWYFLKDMDQSEVLFLKCYDSAAETESSQVALCTPHTAFHWRDGPANAAPRRSLEIRALIFSDPE